MSQRPDFQYQSFVEPLLTDAPAVFPELSWHPTYPDWLPYSRLSTPDSSGAFFFLAAPSETAPLSWSPIYPDFILRSATHPATHPDGGIKPVSPPDTPEPRAGSYSDGGLVRRPLFLGYQAQALPLEFGAPVDQFAWRPIVPDQIDRPTVRAADQPFFTTGSTASTLPVPHLSWLGVWPDWLRPAPGVAAQQALAFDPFPQTPVDQFGWRPVAPDHIHRPTLPTAAYPFLATGATSSTIPIADLRWQGRWPDQIDRLTTPAAQQQALFLDPLPRPSGLDTLNWRPIAPDWIARRVLPTADYPFVATGATSSTIPVADLRWQATYPDRIDRPVLPTALRPSFVLDPLPRPADVDTFAWRPISPDWVASRRLPSALYLFSAFDPFPRPSQAGDATAARAAASGLIRRPPQIQYIALTGPMFPAAVPPIGGDATAGRPSGDGVVRRPLSLQYQSIAWPPFFAVGPGDATAGRPSGDGVVRRPLSVQYQGIAWPPAFTLGGQILEWLGYQPALLSSIHTHPSLFQTVAFDVEPAPDPTQLGWQPWFPDWLARREMRAALQQAVALVTPVTEPFTDLRWKPVYPDWLEAPRGLKPFLHLPFAINVDPIPDAAPTDMKWQGRFPDQIWPKAGLRTASQLPYVANLDPIPNPAAPTFSGSPIYPDFLRRVPQVIPAGATAPLIHTLFLSPLAWKPVAPDFLRRRPQPVPPFSTPFEFSTEIQIPIVTGWRPTYPDRLWSRPPLVPGQGLWQIDAETLGDLAVCVHWCQEALTQPTLQMERLTRPGFCQNEGLVSPTFKLEALC